jgi:hypothetical protein
MLNTQSRLSLNLHRHRRFIECSGNSVDGNRIVGVGRIGADIADNQQLAVWSIQALHIDKVRDLGHQLYAIDEDVALHDLRERSALGSFRQVPRQDVLGRYASS